MPQVTLMQLISMSAAERSPPLPWGATASSPQVPPAGAQSNTPPPAGGQKKGAWTVAKRHFAHFCASLDTFRFKHLFGFNGGQPRDVLMNRIRRMCSIDLIRLVNTKNTPVTLTALLTVASQCPPSALHSALPFFPMNLQNV